MSDLQKHLLTAAIVMLVAGVIMLFTEWFTGIRWVPAVVLLAIIAATLLTIYGIFPVNKELEEGIRDPERLKTVFHSWANLNRLRVSLWAVEWAAMMYWFYKLAWQARADA